MKETIKVNQNCLYKKSKCTYVYVANTDKYSNLLHDRPALSTNKTATVLTTTKIWSCVPEGLNAKTD